MYKLITRGGYPFDEVTSALIKTLRRGHEQEALFWGLELLESFPGALWKRLAIFAAEDVGLADPRTSVLIDALWGSWERIRKIQGKRPVDADLAVMGLLYLCRAPKSREVDAAKNWMLDRRQEGYRPEIPPEALDVHTTRGRQDGKTDLDWWRDDAWLPPGGYGKYEWYARLKQQSGTLPEENPQP